jgi:hypothetical protein
MYDELLQLHPSRRRKTSSSVMTKNDTLKVATLVQQIMTELSEALSEKKIFNGHYKNRNY